MNPPMLMDETNGLVGIDSSQEIDPIEEMRLRTWARRNFVPALQRNEDWHGIVLDEMARIDHESGTN